MSDQTPDTAALASADELALVQGMADENTDAADVWAELDQAEADMAAAETSGGFTAESDFIEGDAAPDDGAGPEIDGTIVDETVQVAPANAAPATPSIWDSAPAELRTEFERVTAENARLAQKERSATGRATGFQRRYEDLLKAAQPREVKGDRPSPDAALAAIKQDYPEIAEPLGQVLTSIHGDVATLSEAEDSRRKAAEDELSDFLAAEEETLLSQHPDYGDVVKNNGERFVAWIDDQPRAVRDAFARNADQIVNAAEAASVISAFKDHLNPPAAAPAGQPGHANPPLSNKRERQLGSTAAPGSRTRRPTVSGIPENGDPQAIWDAFEASEQR